MREAQKLSGPDERGRRRASSVGHLLVGTPLLGRREGGEGRDVESRREGEEGKRRGYAWESVRKNQRAGIPSSAAAE